MFWKKRENRSPELDGGQQETSVLEEATPEAAVPELVAELAPDEPEDNDVKGTMAEQADEPVIAAAPDMGLAQLEGRVIEAICTVFDPEIPVNIYELGLIYDIRIDAMSDVKIDMTLTSPACPVAESLPGDVQMVVEDVEGVRAVNVELVWEPQWTPDRMSEAARLELGFM
jgi:FeS assembly SUF system protein